MNKALDIVQSAAILIVWMYVYNNTVFKCMPGIGYLGSRGVLVAMILTFIVLSKLLKFREKSEIVDGMVRYGMGFGLYTFISYLNVYVVLCQITLVITVVLILISMVIVVKSTKKCRMKIIVKCAVLVISITTITLSVPIITAKATGCLFPANMHIAEASTSGEMTLDNNMETASKVLNGEWEDLSVRQKVKVLDTFAGIECNYIGINRIPVKAEPLDENVLGSYDDSKKVILININYLDESSSVRWVKTICHECYHAYQYELIRLMQNAPNDDLMIFDRVKGYKYDLEHYVSGNDDLMGYSSQSLEVDADKYAESAWSEYETRITEYLER